MRRIWVAVLTTWALIAIVGLLAWTHRPGSTPAGAQAVVVRGAGGASRVVLLPSPAVHGTTQTSPAAAGATPIALAPGANATAPLSGVTGG
jgi:hypothetical protein